MVVLSLFDGMSCGQIALKELGVKVDKYYASEIDKHAIKQTMLNFPDTIQLGSVTDVDVSKLDKIDLLIGGSPCTNFSFAGKRNGMSTTTNEEIYTLDRYLELKKGGFQFEGESFLFWEYMRILNDIRKYNPNVKFLLENVEMGKKWERTLSEAIGLFGVHINSALVSAQNRKRIYWTNIRTKQMGLFGDVYSDIPQPEDSGILLKDILEEEVDEKYYLSEKTIKTLSNRPTGYNFNVVDKNNKSGCLRKDIAKNGTTDTYIKISKNENGETSRRKDNLIMQLNTSKESGGNQPYQHNRVYDTNGISPCLNTDARVPSILTIEDYRIRRLTPTECFRLQTIPEWYRWECSDTQAYKMLGNGWTVEVIKHILQLLEF